ncbi:hypothetical protein KC980_02805 [candidate division WWE3 bacterium]|uniref:Uncharacterized protein n=1 Tax=candidate division WWE3 bacterium TaxID=2053526 RepID=A0A955ECX1_UNCKA|nr:hypothetical protein [candidate division WWE3 bacterium]
MPTSKHTTNSQIDKINLDTHKTHFSKIGIHSKTIFLALLLAITSLSVTVIIYNITNAPNQLSPSLEQALYIGFGFFVLTILFALSLPSWKTTQQFIIYPGAIAIGVFFGVITLGVLQALAIALATLTFMALEMRVVLRTKNMLVKVMPALIFRTTVNAIAFSFGILASYSLMLNSGLDSDFGVTNIITDITSNQIESLIQPHNINPLTPALNTTIQNVVNKLFPNSNIIDTSTLESFRILEQPTQTTITKQLKEQANSRIELLIAPYKKYIAPLIAVALFGSIQLIGIVTGWIIFLTINPIFELAKGFGFLHVKKELIEAEILTF